MLVCNVSLRAPRLGIPATVAETATAADAITAGAVFAALVDDPAFATDTVAPYTGEIMIEAASAADTVSAGGVSTGTITETATAATAQDGSVTAGFTGATFDGTTANVVLSNGNLTVLHNNTTTNSGAISTAMKSTGKYYFEVKLENTTTTNNFAGIMSSGWTSVFSTTQMTTNSTSVQFGGSGSIYSNGGNTGKTLGATAVNDVYSCAIDLTGHLAWFRKNGGNWNGDASANPATGTGGVTIASGSFAPIVRFITGIATTDQMTGNFGQAAFVYSVPSGFSSGWPA